MSGPEAFIYVAYDEHCCDTSVALKQITPLFHTLETRFADDLFLAVAAPIIVGTHAFSSLVNFYKNNLYEHDLENNNIQVLLDRANDKYLDSDVVTFDSDSKIKVVYHNKNRQIIQTKKQAIGRCHDAQAASSKSAKITAVSSLLVRIAVATSFEIDILKPTLEILFEMHTLNYKKRDLESAIMKVRRSRPTAAWKLALDLFLKLASHIDAS